MPASYPPTYIAHDSEGRPHTFRSDAARSIWLQEEEDIANLDLGPFTAADIDELPGKGRHFVYSLYAVIPGVCPVRGDLAPVYVGVTSNLRQRMRAHSKKWWWAMVGKDLVEFIEYPTRERAEQAELRSIVELDPDLNVLLGVGRKRKVAR